MHADSLERIRNLVTDLQLIEGTRGIISLFSAREAPIGGRLPGPLFPDPLPEGAEYDQLVERVMANEILRGKLLSEDGTLALVVLSLEPEIVSSRGLNDVVNGIRETIDIRSRRLRARPGSSPACRSCSSKSATRWSATG